MSGTDMRRLVVALACVVTGCASNPAPDGFLPNSLGAQSDSYGGWVTLTYRADTTSVRATGELIAVTPDTMWVLSAADRWTIPTADITGGQLVAYDAEAGQVVMMTALGTVSTIANGAFLIFTAPMWLIGGNVAGGAQNRVSLHDLRRTDWVEIRPFARFPQGMPPGLSLAQLVVRPNASD